MGMNRVHDVRLRRCLEEWSKTPLVKKGLADARIPHLDELAWNSITTPSNKRAFFIGWSLAAKTFVWSLPGINRNIPWFSLNEKQQSFLQLTVLQGPILLYSFPRNMEFGYTPRSKNRPTWSLLHACLVMPDECLNLTVDKWHYIHFINFKTSSDLLANTNNPVSPSHMVSQQADLFGRIQTTRLRSMSQPYTPAELPLFALRASSTGPVPDQYTSALLVETNAYNYFRGLAGQGRRESSDEFPDADSIAQVHPEAHMDVDMNRAKLLKAEESDTYPLPNAPPLLPRIPSIKPSLLSLNSGTQSMYASRSSDPREPHTKKHRTKRVKSFFHVPVPSSDQDIKDTDVKTYDHEFPYFTFMRRIHFMEQQDPLLFQYMYTSLDPKRNLSECCPIYKDEIRPSRSTLTEPQLPRNVLVDSEY
jgi:hypothetical protein